MNLEALLLRVKRPVHLTPTTRDRAIRSFDELHSAAAIARSLLRYGTCVVGHSTLLIIFESRGDDAPEHPGGNKGHDPGRQTENLTGKSAPDTDQYGYDENEQDAVVDPGHAGGCDRRFMILPLGSPRGFAAADARQSLADSRHHAVYGLIRRASG